ncbi:MAG: acetyl-CoA carboxylase, carboxyltransferase subunit beta [Verrucomicrobiales bacterium]
MGIFQKREFRGGNTKRNIPEGMWIKCPSCGEVLHKLALEENQQVCPKCGHHFTIPAHTRIKHLCDAESFQEMDTDLRSVDPLEFTGVASYLDRLKAYQARTGLLDAVVTGMARLEGRPIALAVMDFRFLAATMGSVVGEKITRLIEKGTQENAPVIIISASGGARMYEGMLSLMQMAKTSGALARHAQAGLPYLSILTNPTTAGVMASYASLGDLIIAEPKAMIGFAGPRVIRETTHQDLPEGFQTAEFLQDHGLVDMIVPRLRMRHTVATALNYLHKPQAASA